MNRRKQYRPKQIDKTGGLFRLQRRAVENEMASAENIATLEMTALTAIAAIANGAGTTAEWDSIAKAINHGWTLANAQIGPEAMPILQKAEQAMRRVAARYRVSGKIGFDGQGLQDVRDAIAIWGEQIRISKIGEIDAATRAVEREYWRQKHV